MDRIIAPGSVDAAHADTAPATGTPGHATDGNPATNTPATQWPAYQYNAMQEEFIAMIVGGGLTPDRNDNGQMLKAVLTLIQHGAPSLGIDGGTANAYQATFSPTVVAVANGLPLRFTVNAANTGASTFAPDSVAAKPIVGLALTALQGGELVAGGVAIVVYSATLDKWILLSCTGAALQIATATQPDHAMQFGQATGRLLGVQTFTSNGTYTPGTYNGVTATMVRKRICGGGGGGGGAPTTTSSQVAVANGGNGGAYVEWIGPAASETVTIGAGGTAGTAGPNAGGAGGTTSAGSITAVGGFGGTTGGATTPPYINPGQANNGGGALGPSGGGNITVSRGCSLGGYGLSVGLAGVIGGQGGDSAFSPSYKSASIPSSTSYGAGGGGAANGPSASAAAGTIGRPGVVIYEEYA